MYKNGKSEMRVTVDSVLATASYAKESKKRKDMRESERARERERERERENLDFLLRDD